MRDEIVIPDTSAWYFRAADYLLPVSLAALVGVMAYGATLF